MNTQQQEEAIVNRVLLIPLDKWKNVGFVDSATLYFSTKLNGVKIVTSQFAIGGEYFLEVNGEVIMTPKLNKLTKDLVSNLYKEQQKKKGTKISEIYNRIMK